MQSPAPQAPTPAQARREIPAKAPWEIFVAAGLGVATVIYLVVDWQLAWMPGVAGLLMLSPARRCVWMLAGATTLLLLIGGAVTTYRVGMAVPDWPATMGQNMFTYPLGDMLDAGWGVTLEHSHRLWASLVGLLTLGVAWRAWREKASWLRLSLVAVVVVILQGVIGGTRVLENNQDIAFLHGSFAQVFYGFVLALLVVSSPAFAASRALPSAVQADSQRLGAWPLIGLLAVYGQIVVGAWLRHSGFILALFAHILLAFAVTGILIGLAARLQAVAQDPKGRPWPDERAHFLGLRRWMLLALASQILLGVAATTAIFGISQGFQGQVSWPEAVSATLHVAVGALLLGSTVAALLWGRRLWSATPAPSGLSNDLPTGTAEATL